MDPVTLSFYAIICGCLSAASPVIPSLLIRLVIGAIVGLVAALALPVIKGYMHLY